MSTIYNYYPNYRQKTGFFASLVGMIKNIIKSKELILVLFKRDFLNTYRKSFLGVIWVLIGPVVGIVSWVFMNSTGILKPGDVGIPYEAHVLFNSSIWGLFMSFYTSAAGTLGSGTEFIMQVKYPHEALLFKQTLLSFVNFLISFVLTLGVLILFGVKLSPLIILFPIIVLPLFFFGAAIGLVISVISVVAPDLSNIFNIALGFVFYITPIIYSANDRDTGLQKIIALNPLTYIVGGARDLILYGHTERLDIFIIMAFVSFILFLFSWRLFYLSEERVVEKMI